MPLFFLRTGNVDIVKDQQTGLLFTTGNTVQLKEAIAFALTEKNKMVEMADTLQKEVHIHYQHIAVWQKILQHYTQLQSAKKETATQSAPIPQRVIEWCRHIASQLLFPGFGMEKQLSGK